jgi:hypothetical protein
MGEHRCTIADNCEEQLREQACRLRVDGDGQHHRPRRSFQREHALCPIHARLPVR